MLSQKVTILESNKTHPWADAHFHRITVLDFEQYQAAEALVDHSMFGGIGPEDWSEQEVLKSLYPEKVELCFGVHPEWLAQKDLEIEEPLKFQDCVDQALDQLSQQIHKVCALGEMGLDFRPKILRQLETLQRDVFLQQLELAEFSAKPVVLHLVQCHQEVMAIFSNWGGPKHGGLVHGFNGSAKKAEDFLKHGLYLSIGGSLVYKDNPQLRQAVLEIPIDRMLLETDTVSGEVSVNLYSVAEQVGMIKKMSPEEVLNQTGQNFYNLLGKGHTLGTK